MWRSDFGVVGKQATGGVPWIKTCSLRPINLLKKFVSIKSTRLIKHVMHRAFAVDSPWDRCDNSVIQRPI
jgi:hypothetical protein